MPAASRTCFGAAMKIEEKIDDGPALELIGLVCMTVSEMLLRIGMAAIASDPNDPFNDVHSAVYDTKAEPVPCCPELRASSHTSKGANLSQEASVGWARYVDGIHTLEDASTLPPCVAAVSASAGSMSFSPQLPFKSLSLSMDDYRFAHEMMSELYVPVTTFTNFSTSGRRGLDRSMMELVAGKYAEKSQCSF